MSEDTKHIRSLKQGSYSSFTILYNRYIGTLYSFVYKLTGDKDISKDIVQEAFIKVWLNRDNIDEDQSFRNYIFTIARNTLVSELRKNVNKSLSIDSVEDIPFNINEPIENSEYTENQLHKIQLAKKELPPRQLELFEMNKEEGLSIKEIAKKTNLSEQSVKNQISLAVKKIRQYMASLFL